MAFNINQLLSRKNLNLIVGLITLLIVLWVIMFAVPGLFVNLFYSGLGNLLLVLFIILALMYNINLGVGLVIVFVILYRFSRMSSHEGLVGSTIIVPLAGGAIPPPVIPV
jgi:hypothetical protein